MWIYYTNQAGLSITPREHSQATCKGLKLGIFPLLQSLYSLPKELRITGSVLRMTEIILRINGNQLRLTEIILRLTGIILRLTGIILRLTGITLHMIVIYQMWLSSSARGLNASPSSSAPTSSLRSRTPIIRGVFSPPAFGL